MELTLELVVVDGGEECRGCVLEEFGCTSNGFLDCTDETGKAVWKVKDTYEDDRL